MKISLKIANVYQIITWMISAGIYIYGTPDSKWSYKDAGAIILSVGVICLSLLLFCLICIYFLLISIRDGFPKNLVFNKWLSFIQILSFSLMGFSFNFIIGLQIYIQ